MNDEKKKSNLNEKFEEVVELADKVGAEQSFYYKTTLLRYQTQLNIISEVQKKAKTNGWTKELINDYNKTCTGANNTVATLMKIITTLAENGLIDSNNEDSLFV